VNTSFNGVTRIGCAIILIVTIKEGLRFTNNLLISIVMTSRSVAFVLWRALLVTEVLRNTSFVRDILCNTELEGCIALSKLTVGELLLYCPFSAILSGGARNTFIRVDGSVNTFSACDIARVCGTIVIVVTIFWFAIANVASWRKIATNGFTKAVSSALRANWWDTFGQIVDWHGRARAFVTYWSEALSCQVVLDCIIFAISIDRAFMMFFASGLVSRVLEIAISISCITERFFAVVCEL
jgi:hypothetical protein